MLTLTLSLLSLASLDIGPAIGQAPPMTTTPNLDKLLPFVPLAIQLVQAIKAGDTDTAADTGKELGRQLGAYLAAEAAAAKKASSDALPWVIRTTSDLEALLSNVSELELERLLRRSGWNGRHAEDIRKGGRLAVIQSLSEMGALGVRGVLLAAGWDLATIELHAAEEEAAANQGAGA